MNRALVLPRGPPATPTMSSRTRTARTASSQYDFPRRLKKGWRAQVSRSQGDIYYVDANGRSVYDHPGYSGCGIGSWWYHK
eukprot:COSAG04_NODE_1198_length_7778_cov_17.966402_6_plen_81_part_00